MYHRDAAAYSVLDQVTVAVVGSELGTEPFEVILAVYIG
jgi:hypothetical protein